MSVWIDPKVIPPTSEEEYIIWNEETSQQEFGHCNRHGIWFSRESIDPIVTRYAEKMEDPK